MPDAEKREGQKEIETAYCPAAADPKCPGDVRRENLRGNDHRKDRGNDRSPQNGEQTGAAVFDVGRMFRIAAASYLEHFRAGDAFGIRQVGRCDQGAAQRD